VSARRVVGPRRWPLRPAVPRGQRAAARQRRVLVGHVYGRALLHRPARGRVLLVGQVQLRILLPVRGWWSLNGRVVGRGIAQP
jgi:hypothetical protein